MVPRWPFLTCRPKVALRTVRFVNISGLLRRGHDVLSSPGQAGPPEPHEHVVHFYSRDEALLNTLEEYIVEGTRLGETAVVIATPAHCQALRDRLATWGLEECFLGLDAQDMLSRVMVDGMPDQQLFDASVGSLVRTRVSAGGVRAYGEMVALLWAEQNRAGTFALEQMWNALQQEVRFPLLCAYPLNDVSEDLGEGLAHVCQLHTHVVRLAA